MATAMVTGGLGFIGSNLAKELARQGHRVVVVDNGDDDVHILRRQSMIDYPNIEFWEFSCDSWAVERIFENEKPEWVFHLAATPRIGECEDHPYASTTNNVSVTAHLLGLSVRYGAKSFVFSSSSSVYGPGDSFQEHEVLTYPSNLYGLQKWLAERICQHVAVANQTMRVTCLRYFNVYGPGQYETGSYATAVGSWLNCIRKGEPLRKDGAGNQKRDMVFVDDVVKANLLAAQQTNYLYGVFNVGTGISVSNNEILEMLKARFGELNIVQAPERPNDIPETKSMIHSILDEFGWYPTTPFVVGLDKTIKWMRLKTLTDAAK